MQNILSFFTKSQNTLKRYRMEMRKTKEDFFLKQGREQFRKLIEKGIKVPVALL